MRINSLVDALELENEVVTLSRDESHHLVRVLRICPGQEITLFDGQGGVADATVTAVSKTAVEARILNHWKVPPPAVEITLIQALPKPDRWEWVLQKAVELGAADIQPLLTQHTEFKPGANKEERWQKIVLNAAQQCEVRWLPRLHPVKKFDTMVSSLGHYDLVLVGSLYEGAKPMREVQMGGMKKIALLIGPEGDFSREEVDAVVRVGASPVSFGRRILRTETAAIFGLSALAYELL